jgi:superfamily II DNA or RNA helicase
MSTSSGKTLMSYILFKYMIDVLKLKHILYITPNTTLTTQTSEKFILYEEQNKIERTWKYNEIYSGSKNVSSEIPEIVFGNYQSLCKKKREYLEQFDCVIEDECHHSRSSTNKAIISKCINAKYKIGMTGTFPKDGSYDSFVLQSYIGPVVYRLSQYRLINDENSATPIYVIGLLLDYLDVEDKDKFYNLRKNKERGDVKTSGKIYNTEKEIARRSYKRFKYICDTIKKTTKNSLVLFTDIQNEYGKRIYNSIKEYSDKNVYYVDGSTKSTLRDYAISQMENDLDGNTIIVASVKCFSEGVDICNLFNIFLVETTKSDNIIAQILGRGMRKFEGKERTLLFDFGDNFKYCRNNDIHHSKNYLLRHYNERAAIYRERGFPYQSYDIKID